LQQSSLDAAGALSFLHENLPQFVHEDAMDNMALMATYLSDAGGSESKP